MARYCDSVLVMLVLLFSTPIATAYPTPVDFDGKLLRWNIGSGNPQILWTVESSSGENLELFRTLTRDAAALWNGVESSYLKLEAASSDQEARITVHFDDAFSGNSESSGYAEFDEQSNDGPVHCSIHVAASNTGLESLARTTLHELGHCIGLGHSLIEESIMSYSLTRNSFALALDDQAAISRLYPADNSAPRLPPGCSIGSFEHNGVSFTTILVVIGPLLFWLVTSLGRLCFSQECSGLRSLGSSNIVPLTISLRRISFHVTSHIASGIYYKSLRR